MNRRLISALLGAALVALVSACNPAPPPTGGGTTAQRWVFSDSNGALVVQSGVTTGDGRDYRVQAGADLLYWDASVDWAIGSTPRLITLALGSNDAGLWGADGGWTSGDEAVWSWKIASVKPETRVIVLLPYFRSTVGSAQMTEITEARLWLKSLVGVRGGLCVSDAWRTWVLAHPGDIGPDGIHIVTASGMAGWHDAIAAAETGGGCL